MSILYYFTMPRPPKRKAAHQKVSRDEGGRFIRSEHDFINTEASTLEIVETGLGDDLLSEQLWENDEVSDWGSDVDSEAEQDICNRLLRDDVWLKWRPDANLEKSSRGPYKVGKMPKSTYYDKWGAKWFVDSSSKGGSKIRKFF